jgi:hypothetical protein
MNQYSRTAMVRKRKDLGAAEKSRQGSAERPCTTNFNEDYLAILRPETREAYLNNATEPTKET